jgi:hypothetical protein
MRLVIATRSSVESQSIVVGQMRQHRCIRVAAHRSSGDSGKICQHAPLSICSAFRVHALRRRIGRMHGVHEIAMSFSKDNGN